MPPARECLSPRTSARLRAASNCVRRWRRPGYGESWSCSGSTRSCRSTRPSMPPAARIRPGTALRAPGQTCELTYAGGCLHISRVDDDDAVFRALADPTRRALLDRLRERNGQTLGELCGGLAMARQSATQHLGVLESANLISTVRRGREKLHYLNPVPLWTITERWIE